jgi:glycosyltransferase involved in cell wall biosynthesis
MVAKGEPLVSIIVNCFNGEKFLGAALDSIVSQTYQNWEVIFWDNQSTDQSANIFIGYCDDRFRYFYAPSHTVLYEARNSAVDQARGNYVAFLDVDDLWSSLKLARQIPLFQDSGVGLVACKSWLLNENSNARKKMHENDLPTGWVLSQLVEKYFLVLSSLVVRKSAFYSMENGFDATLNVLGDMDFFIRLAINWKLDCLQDELAVYRLHGDNMGQNLRETHAREYKKVVKKFRDSEFINKLPELDNLENELIYVEGQRYVIKRNIKMAIKSVNSLPYGKLKIKLIILLVVPRPLLRWLRGLSGHYFSPALEK